MKKEVTDIRKNLLKNFGTNSVIMGEDMEKFTFGRIPTGSLMLDVKLGGGIPIGRIVQIAGEKSTAKSTLCDHITREAQRHKVNWEWTKRAIEKGQEKVTIEKREEDGLICAYLDVEGTKTSDWTSTMGVDISKWLYARPAGLEETLEMAHQMQIEGVKFIVIDSVDSMEALKVQESEVGESVQMGLKPKMLGEYLRKVTATNNKLVRDGELPCTVILINQLREKIGQYGDPLYTPGGKAIDFYVSIDIRLRKGEWIIVGSGDSKEIVGQEVKFKTHKNKTFQQQLTGAFDFYIEANGPYKAGEIDNFKEIVQLGMEYGVIERAGSWFKYKGDNLAQGADNTIQMLKNEPKIYEKIKSDLFKIVKAM